MDTFSEPFDYPRVSERITWIDNKILIVEFAKGSHDFLIWYRCFFETNFDYFQEYFVMYSF